MSTEYKITGYYGCDCHPFATWEECKAAYKQKFEVGQKVRHRHKEKEGIIDTVLPDKGFVIVKYGKLQSDRILAHVQQLIKL